MEFLVSLQSLFPLLPVLPTETLELVMLLQVRILRIFCISHWDHRRLHGSFRDLKIFFTLPKLFTCVRKLTMNKIQNVGYEGGKGLNS